MRILILSADVAGGHDAAAAALARQVTGAGGSAVAAVENGLAVLGPVVHRLVRDGYRFQIQSVAGSYGPMLRVACSPMMSRLLRRFVGWKGRRRTRRLIRSFAPTAVVATHPFPAMVLSELRRRGTLRVPAIEMTTDPDPLPIVMCPHLDRLLVSTPMDVGSVAAHAPRLRTVFIAPPVADGFLHARERVAARRRLGMASESRPVILVSGGSWAVGGMAAIVDVLASSDVRVLVLCADNQRLRAEIARRYEVGHVDALAYRDDMPDLIAAADAVVHTGAGVTGFETMATGTPLLIVSPIPGHGERSARALHRYGLALLLESPADLAALVSEVEQIRTITSERCAAGRSLFDAISAGDAVAHATVQRVPYRRRAMRQRVATCVAAMVIAMMASGEAMESSNALAHGIGARTHRVTCLPFRHVPLLEHLDRMWLVRGC